MSQVKGRSPNRKHILSLDGGGVRGILSIAIIERVEKIIRERSGDRDANLHSYFDLVGGTSTGAIIGAALSLGYSAEEIRALYFDLAPKIFRKPRYRLKMFQPAFDARTLNSEIKGILGDTTLDSTTLKTGLAIVMKRMDTGSAWIVTNNPNSKYWEDPGDNSYIGNRHYRVSDLVRASTAAPYYFAPHEIKTSQQQPAGLFVDGGVSPYNNPALGLFHVATIPAYGYAWPIGQHRLNIISVGTGIRSDRLSLNRARKLPAIGLAMEALKGMVLDAETQAMTILQTLGHTDTPWFVNSEIGNLDGVSVSPDPLFTIQRYNVRLETDWLRSQLGISITETQAKEVSLMENADAMPLAYEIGQAAAEKFVQAEHFPLADA